MTIYIVGKTDRWTGLSVFELQNTCDCKIELTGGLICSITEPILNTDIAEPAGDGLSASFCQARNKDANFYD